MGTGLKDRIENLAPDIAKLMVNQVELEANSPVELSQATIEFAFSLMASPRLKLEGLLAQVTEYNLHGEIDTGSPVGREEW